MLAVASSLIKLHEVLVVDWKLSTNMAGQNAENVGNKLL